MPVPLPVYTVTALRLGTITVDKSGMTYGVDPGVTMDVPVWGAAVEGDGVRMLVDTGIGDPARWQPYNRCWQEDDETLPAALAEIGWALSDVDVVINSHLHYDHAENNLLLPDAQFYVSAAEWEYAKAPIATQRWLYDFAWTDEHVTYQNYTLVAQDHYTVRPGIRLIETPGHSRGHVSLWRAADRTLICGDVYFNAPRLREPLAGLTLDPDRNRESMRRLAELEPALVLFGHGPPLRDTQRFVEFGRSV